MISCADIRGDVIRRHYDISTLFYRLLWGRHIHHGLWEQDDTSARVTPAQAAQQLTEELARLVGIQEADRVIDVGCGMGGSSIHLARAHRCQVTGITISPFQRHWATWSSRLAGTRQRTQFLCQDAEHVRLADQSADIVWSIECTEHLFGKPEFFRRAAGWLRPGGRMAICAWLAADDPLTRSQEQQVYDVCEGFFCPSLGSAQDYSNWMTAAGLQMKHVADWTVRVRRTWEICRDRINRFGIRRMASWIDPGQIIFLDRFQTLLDAYNSGAMKYGCFIAEKPE
ncbi:MAG: class I SAM-dependent methyltransferase [Planctomycetaceae bacterium]